MVAGRLGLLAIALLTAPAVAEETPATDVDLVLAIDCSSSVTPDEFAVQMAGFAAAFRDPDVIAAAASGAHHAVAVEVVEWSYARWQQVVIPWQLVGDAATAEALAAAFDVAPRIVHSGETSISGAIDFAVAQLNQRAATGQRRVIDVSGDGSNNQGRPAHAARDAAVAQGITINGLTLLHEERDLDAFFRAEVIGGPGAFVQRVETDAAYARAIDLKLRREIGAPIAFD